jgi:hypothetical protein
MRRLDQGHLHPLTRAPLTREFIVVSLLFFYYKNCVIPENDHEDVEGSCQDLLLLGRVNPVGFEDADISVDTQTQRDDLKSNIAHSGTMNICRHSSTEG